jgi:hypothetical protein
MKNWLLTAVKWIAKGLAVYLEKLGYEANSDDNKQN